MKPWNIETMTPRNFFDVYWKNPKSNFFIDFKRFLTKHYKENLKPWNIETLKPWHPATSSMFIEQIRNWTSPSVLNDFTQMIKQKT